MYEELRRTELCMCGRNDAMIRLESYRAQDRRKRFPNDAQFSFPTATAAIAAALFFSANDNGCSFVASCWLSTNV